MSKRVGLTAVVVLLAGLAASPTAIAGRVKSHGPKLTTTIDGKRNLPPKVRWLARPPGKASAVKEMRFLIDGKLRWTESHVPFNYGSDDLHGHLGWLTTSWLSPGRHRFTARALLKSGRKVSDTVIARVGTAPAPPAELAGRWTRTVTEEDQARVDPRLVGVAPPTGTWALVFDRVGAWDLDPQGGGVVEHVRFHPGTIRIDAPIWITPIVKGATALARYGATNIGGIWGAAGCRDDGPPATYRSSVANHQLTLTPIDEPCLLRRVVWAGTWARVR